MSTDPTSTTALDFASAFLAVVLEAGPMPAEAVTTRAANVGISARTLRRAREQLGVKVRKTSAGPWEWQLGQVRREGDQPEENGRVEGDQPDTVPAMAASINLGSSPATAEQLAKIAKACARFPLDENFELYEKVIGRSIYESRPLNHAEATVLIAAHEKRAKR